MRWTQGERQEITTRDWSWEVVITSPPSDTIWLNTCSRITFTWWMGWSECGLDIDHHLILTDNWENFVLPILFSALLSCTLHLSSENRLANWSLCLCYWSVNWSLLWVCINTAQWTAEAKVFVLFSIAAFSNYLFGSIIHLFQLHILLKLKPKFRKSS